MEVCQPASSSDWWLELAKEAMGGEQPNITGPLLQPGKECRIEDFARKCYRLFFRQKLSKESYFRCCSLVWLVQCLDQQGIAGAQLWKAVESTMAVSNSATINSSVEQEGGSCMMAWILPSMNLKGLGTTAGTPRATLALGGGIEDDNDGVPDPDQPYIYRWIQFWQQFYHACESSAPLPSRPSKRQRNTYHYPFSASSPRSSATSFDDLLKGSYNLPAAIALASILLECATTANETALPTNENEESDPPRLTWQVLDHQAHGLAKVFKTLTVEDIQAALTVLGMQCLQEGRQIPGLTPRLIFDDYLSRTGESILVILKEATQLDDYPLRAVICEHLLEPIYNNGDNDSDDAMSEEEAQLTIRLCNDFLNREIPSHFINSLSTHNDTEQANRRRRSQLHQDMDSPKVESDLHVWKNETSRVPARVSSPRYPLMMHLQVWLLQDEILRVADLVRLMDNHPKLDGLLKDEACLLIWEYLLRNGLLFLDGNNTQTKEYIQKRELLYNGVVSGMGAYGRGSMMDYYQTLALKIWEHSWATLEEKHYILVACQHTLLRLLFKCRGLGSSTVSYFWKETKWPLPLGMNENIASVGNQTMTTMVSPSLPTANLEEWAVRFLSQTNPIPESLLVENIDGKAIVDLQKFLNISDEDERIETVKNNEVVVVVDEENVVQEAAVDPKGTPSSKFALPEEILGEEAREEEDYEDSNDHMDELQQEEIGTEVLIENQERIGSEPLPQIEAQLKEDNNEMVDLDQTNDHRREMFIGEDSDDGEGMPSSSDGYLKEDQEAEGEDLDEEDPNDSAQMGENKLGEGYTKAYSDDEDDHQFEDEERSEIVAILDSDDSEVFRTKSDHDELVDDSEESHNNEGVDSEIEEDLEDDETPGDRALENVINERDDNDDEGSSDGQDYESINDEAVARESPIQVDSENEILSNDKGKSNDDIEIDCSQDINEDDSVEMNEKVTSPYKSPEKRDSLKDDIAGREEAAQAIAGLFESRESSKTAATLDLTVESPITSERKHPKSGDDSSLKSPKNDSQKTKAEFEGANNELHSMKRKLVETLDGGVEVADEAISETRSSIGVDGPTLQNDDEEPKSTEGHASQEGGVESDATDDEQERVLEVEKAETEDAAVGGEFGDTTDDENDVPTSSTANMLADADRRADVLRASGGYASQLEEGYEPEDTHGYTEEEVSEAIHTEDEEEERILAAKSKAVKADEAHNKEVHTVHHSIAHSSDDMDDADEHTEHEEDLGAESSELEETTEAADYAFSPSSEHARDPTTLLEFAQTAQRLDQYRKRSSPTKSTPTQTCHNQSSEYAAESEEKKPQATDKSVGFLDQSDSDLKIEQSTPVKQTDQIDSEVQDSIVSEGGNDEAHDPEDQSGNLASVEDEKEAYSTIATESLEHTEDTMEHVDSEAVGTKGVVGSKQVEITQETDTDAEDVTSEKGEQTSHTETEIRQEQIENQDMHLSPQETEEIMIEEVEINVTNDTMDEDMKDGHLSSNDMESEKIEEAKNVGAASDNEMMSEENIDTMDVTVDQSEDAMESEEDDQAMEEDRKEDIVVGMNSHEEMEDVVAKDVSLHLHEEQVVDSEMETEPQHADPTEFPRRSSREKTEEQPTLDDEKNENIVNVRDSTDKEGEGSAYDLKAEDDNQNTTPSANDTTAVGDEEEDNINSEENVSKEEGDSNGEMEPQGGNQNATPSANDTTAAGDEEDNTEQIAILDKNQGHAAIEGESAQKEDGDSDGEMEAEDDNQNTAPSKNSITAVEENTKAGESGKEEEEDSDRNMDDKDTARKVKQGRRGPPRQTRAQTTRQTRSRKKEEKDVESDVNDLDEIPKVIEGRVENNDEESGMEDDEVDSVQEAPRRTRSRAKKDKTPVKDDDRNKEGSKKIGNDVESIQETPRRTRSRATKAQTPADSDDMSIASTPIRRSKRRKPAEQKETEDEGNESVISVATNVSLGSRRSSRLSAKTRAIDYQTTDDEVSTRGRLQKKKAAETNTDEDSIASSTRRSTRQRKKQKKQSDDDESVASVGSRTRGREKKQAGEKKETSVMNTRRSTRSKKSLPKDDINEAASTKPATRSGKGRPPRAPAPRTRASTRSTRKK